MCQNRSAWEPIETPSSRIPVDSIRNNLHGNNEPLVGVGRRREDVGAIFQFVVPEVEGSWRKPASLLAIVAGWFAHPRVPALFSSQRRGKSVEGLGIILPRARRPGVPFAPTGSVSATAECGEQNGTSVLEQRRLADAEERGLGGGRQTESEGNDGKTERRRCVQGGRVLEAHGREERGWLEASSIFRSVFRD